MYNFLISITDIWSDYRLAVILTGIMILVIIAIIVVSVVVRIEEERKVEEVDLDEILKDEKKEQEIKLVSNSLFEILKPDENGELKVIKDEDKTKKKTVAKEAEKTHSKTKETADKPYRKYAGKWIIEKKSEDEFMSKLIASNGEIMLTSEIYTTEEGARRGVATIIKAVETGEFIVYQEKSGDYYYKLKNSGNRFVCAGEIYKTKDRCNKAVDTVKRIGPSAPVLEELTIGEKYVDYTPVKNPKYKVKSGFEGKWRVENKNGKYTAKLFASNGQLMLATEMLSTRKAVVTAIETIKKYSEMGNFVIDKDKFGKFYYKLRNAQKSVICVGEAYEKFSDCVNALESVRKFAATAIYSEE